MPGTIVVRPVEAKFTHDHDFLSKMDPYCIVHLGNQKIKGQVCKSGGKHPHWNDSITVQRGAEPTMIVELKDKDTFTKDDLIGVCQVDLNALESKNNISRWYPVFIDKKPAGEILIDLIYTPVQPKYPLGQQQGGVNAGQMQQGPTVGTVQPSQPSSGHHGGMIPTQTQHGPTGGVAQPSYPCNTQNPTVPTGHMNSGPMSGGSNPYAATPQFNAPNTQQFGYGQPNHQQQAYGQAGYNQMQGQSGYPQGQPGMMQGQGGYPQGQPGMMQGQGGYPQGQPGMMQGQGGYPQGNIYPTKHH